MPTLRIELLGGFRLTLGDTPVTSVNSPRLQALLAYLVLHRHAPQPRSQIAFTFWSDTTEAQAHNNFRQLLFDLRRALPAADSFLEVAGSTLQWRTAAPFSLDVADLENALAAAEQAEQHRDQESEQAALEASALLYRGDLLPSCYDDWIVPTRETLRQKSITALERLIELQEQRRDYRKALSHAQHLLRQDPLHEATYRHLMRLHALSGDRAGVVRVYNTCVQVLQRELSVEPSPGTRTEYEHWLKESLSPSRAPDRALRPPATPRRHNLPFQLTNFIGRERETSQVKELVATHRLVTLTGSGGVGKTRLALRVAADVLETFPDGVWLVDLALLSDPALVPQAVATALEIREAPGSPLLDTLADYVRGKRLLLILDNCEHLAEPVRRLAKTLVETAPNLRVLATSRESLGITGEVTWRVPSLPMPEGHSLEERTPSASASIMQFESLQLFADRAAAVLPTFAVTDANASEVGKICHQLDGIPLAIELAAARVKMLSPQQIATRLDRCFDLLTVGSRTALPRHQTLRATMDWSYQLLSGQERVLLCRLSVFAGSFTVETVEQVCAEKEESAGQIHPSMILDLLSNLIDKSLVVVEQTERPGGKDTETRYRLLETVRQYARERLVDSGESEKIRSRHLDYFMKFAETVEPKLHGPEQMQWLDRLDVEHDNLRAALEWSPGEGRVEKGLRLGAALAWFWERRGYWSEGRERVESLLDQPEAAAKTLVRANGLFAASALAGALGAAWVGGDKASRQYLEEAISIARDHGHAGKRLCALALTFLSNILHADNPALAQSQYDDAWSIAQELGDQWIIAFLLHQRAHWFTGQRDYKTGCNAFEESMLLFRSVGDKRWAAILFGDIAAVYIIQGDYAGARLKLEQNLTYFRETKDRQHICFTLERLGEIARAEGNYNLARRYFVEGLEIARELGSKLQIAGVSADLGFVAVHDGELDSARSLFVESLARSRELDSKPKVAFALLGFASVAAVEKKARRSVQLSAVVDALLEAGDKLNPADEAEYKRNLALARQQLDASTGSAQAQAAFNAAWNEGRAMTLEQAIEYALKDS